MPVINSIINWVNFKRIYQIELFKKHPHEVQREVLFELLEKAANTEFGLKYKFKTISSEKEFRERVPVQGYDDIKPTVERMMLGEKNLLWPGETKWFAKSSGTTNEKSKFIPVSKDSLEDVHIRGGRDVMAIYLKNNPDSGLLSGKALTLGGSHKVNNYNNNSYYGDLSAIIIENIPFWTDFYRTPSTEISLLEEFEEKIEKIIEYSLDENVTSFAGVPSWYLVLLKRVLEVTGKSNILEVWPNLEVFTHGGVKFEPYREQYEKLIPSANMHYMETYNASEGFFGIQDDPDKKDMLLMLDYGIYYEFIPMDEFRADSLNTISLEDVEIGKNYAMVISTNGGLWRYLIGDTVRFTQRYPFKFVITGRTKHYINAFGEEVIIDNAEKAFQIACERTSAIISEYTGGPIYMKDHQKGAHEWIIEFEKKPNDLDHFIQLFDGALKTINSDYEAKRHKSLSLEMPHVIVAKPGLFYEWMKSRGKAGGQNKIPRLANDRQYLDQLIELNQSL
ncbi:auxin-regulated protein [Aquipluma nitroreducens]|uniref:Auxin-regulated protein n=1 Tax=Aquipluma nitroreducens TaxID=2010828 RepID=A0A5K7SA64_9BACT|nr:GH3 auxin-responsive promoter family protein [Aquipluma nitroreducens]BBE18337.1 auxin-regulated protein [Aquipluma nitroreducens]